MYQITYTSSMPKGFRKDGSKLGFQKGYIPWHKGKHIVKITEKICPCGKIFELTPGKVRPKHGKFCSRKCYYTYPELWNRISKKGTHRPPFSEEWKNKISETRIKNGLARGKNNPRWEKN